MAFVGIFYGIGHEVRDHLLDAFFVEGGDEGGVGVLLHKHHVGILDALRQRGADILKVLGEVGLYGMDLDAAASVDGRHR